jgi:hypothetical protein
MVQALLNLMAFRSAVATKPFVVYNALMSHNLPAA